MSSIKRFIPIACLIVIVLDIAYSFYQHSHTSLGGDLAQVVVIDSNQGDFQVLQHPFGISDESYANPNRFFAHWFTAVYFKNVPLLLQHFVSPIQSVYLASAIAKTGIQVILIYLLSVFITSSTKAISKNNLLAAVLVFPFFQTHGFNRYMGIIDQSVVYTFFYALPFCFLLVFYLPLYQKYILHQKFINNYQLSFLFLLPPVLTLSGPLLPGVILIITLLCLLACLRYFFCQSDKPTILYISNFCRKYWCPISLFVFVSLFSLYSLYIGQSSSLNPVDAIGIAERFSNLPKGLFNLVTRKLGLPILLIFVGINYLLLNKSSQSLIKYRLIQFYKWIFLFSIIYLILLPFGGYRIYRPNIIRYDTFIPITLSLIFLFASTTYYLIRHSSKNFQRIYIPLVLFTLLIYINADRLKSQHFYCERDALKELSQATEEPYLLKNNCTVMEWQILDKPEKSKLNAGLFNYWNITKKKRLYFQSKELEN